MFERINSEYYEDDHACKGEIHRRVLLISGRSKSVRVATVTLHSRTIET